MEINFLGEYVWGGGDNRGAGPLGLSLSRQPWASSALRPPSPALPCPLLPTFSLSLPPIRSSLLFSPCPTSCSSLEFCSPSP